MSNKMALDALTAALDAMEHMANTLNNMDAVDEDEDAQHDAAFEAVRAAIAELKKPQKSRIVAAPMASYPEADQRFFNFWYGHMFEDLMQPPLVGIDHATARYIWNAAAIAALQAEPQPKEGATDGLTPEQVRKVCADAERFLGATTNVIDFGLIGSAAWLPQPKDVDYIVLIEDSDERGPDFSVTAFCNALLPQGFENCGDYEMAMNGWNAVRRDDLNLIVTAVEDSYHAYRKAMIVCQALNLTDKKDRRMVCRILRDDLSLDEAKDKWNTEAQIEAAALPTTPPKD